MHCLFATAPVLGCQDNKTWGGPNGPRVAVFLVRLRALFAPAASGAAMNMAHTSIPALAAAYCPALGRGSGVAWVMGTASARSLDRFSSGSSPVARWAFGD